MIENIPAMWPNLSITVMRHLNSGKVSILSPVVWHHLFYSSFVQFFYAFDSSPPHHSGESLHFIVHSAFLKLHYVRVLQKKKHQEKKTKYLKKQQN